MTRFWSEMLPNTSASKSYRVNSYGPVLRQNKALLFEAFRKSQTGTQGQFALILVMAMLETNTLSVSDRDTSKDGFIDGSANCSMFNLSHDLLKFIGYEGSCDELNKASNLHVVVQQIDQGIRQLGVTRFLNYVRGGRQGFLDGHSYGASDYRSTIATMLSVVDAQPLLLTDDRRVDILLAHV